MLVADPDKRANWEELIEYMKNQPSDE